MKKQLAEDTAFWALTSTKEVGEYTVRQRFVRFAYPRNGNSGNTTPEFRYELVKDGKVVDTFDYQRDAVKAALEGGY